MADLTFGLPEASFWPVAPAGLEGLGVLLLQPITKLRGINRAKLRSIVRIRFSLP